MKENKVVITAISKKDAFYSVKNDIIGKTGTGIFHESYNLKGWWAGDFMCDVNIMGSRPTYFYAIKFKPVKES